MCHGAHRRAAAILLLTACSRPPQTLPAPAAAPVPVRAVPGSPVNPTGAAAESAATLPPIPDVDGPLNLRVVYPAPNQRLTVRDSNYVFGSTGSGAARLTIDGADVPVLANGAFLAWLPVPAGDTPRYELRATRGTEEATATVPVRIPALPIPLPDTGALVVDRGSLVPSGRLGLRGDEPVRVAIRAPSNAGVALHLSDGRVQPMVRASGLTWSTTVEARDLSRPGTVVVRRGRDSVTAPTAPVEITDAESRRFVSLLNADVDATSDTDRVAILRPTPGGTYKWFLLPGTVLELTGFRGAYDRVRLDSQLEAWVEASDVQPANETVTRARLTASNARVTSGPSFSDLRIPMTGKPAYQVDATPDALVLTLYGAVSNIDIVNLATVDPTVRDVTWDQVASDRVRITVHLRRRAFGWLVLWERGAIVLRVRRGPAVDRTRPLAGRVIAVDPGHPPAGTTGPTGLYEGDAVLEVAERLRGMLEARGATVVMTRTTPAAVPLGDRAITARRANADAFVSVHLNAYPDGVDPLRARNGTNTYFFYDQAEPLARAVQRGLVRQLGLPDMGVNYDNLAVVRQSWMPAILCEGAFLLVPQQESALRDTGFQGRYAAGIVEGLEAYFRGLAETP